MAVIADDTNFIPLIIIDFQLVSRNVPLMAWNSLEWCRKAAENGYILAQEALITLDTQ